MNSTRYTILFANRKTGAVRRFTLSRRLMAVCGGTVLVLPLLVGMGSGGASQAELEILRSANESLRSENDSYRAATGELTEQIASLQTALSQLGDQAELDPATRQAISRLPAVNASIVWATDNSLFDGRCRNPIDHNFTVVVKIGTATLPWCR